ncbi:uncharacterized protein EI90DRAFT_2084543 [Cantharellus anzutake]|uniref:uncharacterized protein n=1 Tax=Cantharellus anzutake TaxID=1750568 RepID=UPI00190669B0|nr:uncharacterized protein EI90DRAFT_2084543 [Cantharellus anzutake]KAF8340581.1 hypothetical protein EI90DRAFT_2084543 [Cantharellus anzutake]
MALRATSPNVPSPLPIETEFPHEVPWATIDAEPGQPKSPRVPFPSLLPTAPPRSFREPFSFDDGDIILRSSNMVEFRVHALLLQLASPAFSTLIGAPRDEDYVEVPLVSMLLEALLRFNSAIEFQVSCAKSPLLLGIADFLSREPNPLRAWAIAERYGLEQSKNAAARRFIQTDDDLLTPAVSALQHIHALRYNTLLTVKRDVLHRARAAVLNVVWPCPSCSRPSPRWKAAYLTRVAGQNPFTPEITQDSIFELCCHIGGCSGCPGTFHSHEARTARDRLRSALKSILDDVNVR